MMQARSAIVKILRLLLLLPALLVAQARADAYAEVGQLLHDRQFSEALAKTDAFLASKPTDPQMRFLKGVIESRIGRVDAALASFTRLTEDYPELAEPYNNLAVLLAGQGRLEPARAALDMAIRAKPDYGTAQENLGDVYLRLAEQSYARAQTTEPNRTELARKLRLTRELISAIPKSTP